MNLKLTSGYWRYFALLFGGMALAIVVLTYAFYLEEVKNEQQRAMIRDLHHIEIQQTILTDVLKNAFAMLTHIADLVHLLRPSTNPEGRLQLSASFVSILRTRPDFDQVRLLNKQGLEFIRVSRGPRRVRALFLMLNCRTNPAATIFVMSCDWHAASFISRRWI